MCFLLSVDVDSPSRVTAFLLSFWGSSRTPHPLFRFFDEAADLLSGFIISHYIEKEREIFNFFSQKMEMVGFRNFFMDLSFCCKVPFSLYFLHPFALTVAREHFFSLETVSDNT